MPKFRVKTPLRKDGNDYDPGDTVDLTKKEADAIGTDVLDPINEPKPANNDGGGTGR